MVMLKEEGDRAILQLSHARVPSTLQNTCSKKKYWKRNVFSSNRQEWHEFIIRGISHIAILLQICLALFEKALLSIRNSYHPPYHLLFNVLARLVKYLLIKCQVYLAVSATYRNIFFECLPSSFLHHKLQNYYLFLCIKNVRGKIFLTFCIAEKEHTQIPRDSRNFAFAT